MSLRLHNNTFIPADLSDPPFACPPDIVLDLPPPPSVNRTRKVDWKGDALHKRWQKDADKLVLAARSRSRNPIKMQKIAGPFEATIVMSNKLNLIDLDNGIKAIIDYARRIELVVDDSPKYFRRLTVEWGTAIEGCRLTLRECAA